MVVRGDTRWCGLWRLCGTGSDAVLVWVGVAIDAAFRQWLGAILQADVGGRGAGVEGWRGKWRTRIAPPGAASWCEFHAITVVGISRIQTIAIAHKMGAMPAAAPPMPHP